jgi:hypothetical protein
LLQGAGLFKTDNLIVTNGGSVITLSNYSVGSVAGTTNVLAINSGSSLIVSNAALGIGNDGTATNGSGIASATVSNAMVSATFVNIGSTAGGRGALTVQSNAAATVLSNLTVVSGSLSSTSALAVAGGTLDASNAALAIGPSGSGRFDISGGLVLARQITLGGSGLGTSGEMLASGGLVRVFRLSVNAGTVCGGNLDGLGGNLVVGDGHDARLTICSGSLTNYANILVGYTNGFTGIVSNSGGTISVTNSLIVGDVPSGSVGLVQLTGGATYVTNSAQNAVLDVRNGSVLLQSGALLVVDNLILNSSGGHFIKNGGQLTQNHPTTLDPTLDATGEGMPNLWKLAHNLDPLSVAGDDGANGDPDHDGMKNLNEYLSGTDPRNAASVFRLLSAKIIGRDLRLEWTTVGGHTYVVQMAAELSPDSGNFVDASPPLAVTGVAEGTNSYVIDGGAANPAAYYRVQVTPTP